MFLNLIKNSNPYRKLCKLIRINADEMTSRNSVVKWLKTNDTRKILNKGKEKATLNTEK